MIRVLHIVGIMDLAGQETFIMNLYRNIDRKKVQFDFVVHSDKRGYYDDEIEKLGGRIYRITPISKNIFKHMKELKQVVKENKYNIVHRHTASSIVFIDLLVAKKCGVKYRIVHSHNTSSGKGIINKIFRTFLNYYSNYKFACSQDAGLWLYGKNRKFEIIKNGIDIEKFKFSKIIRDKIRKEYNIQDKFVVGNVARFNEQKNHIFLLEVFNEIQKKNENAILLLVGEGEKEIEIRKKIQELKIEKKVIILGVKNNINEILQAMDVFLFPSIFEGLPVALIEAQASGINIFASDTITKDVDVTETINYLNLNLSFKTWADIINNNRNIRNLEISSIYNSGYDVVKNSKDIEFKYINMI